MTCREFKHVAASFNLHDLVQQQDPHMMGHVVSCPTCNAWMEKQRSLNASLHALRTRTSGLEAGSNVEGALLRVFRQGIPAANAPAATVKLAVVAGTRAAVGMKERKPQVAPRSTPFAMRLSRWFEVGAYGAVAAALVIALLLGLHLLRKTPKSAPVESKAISAPVMPAAGEGGAASQAHPASARLHLATGVGARKHVVGQRPVASSGVSTNSDEAQTDADAGYTALMFCDPLSCASDTQVVRMELPDASGTQPQTADLVVGYDGVVRAVRFVN